MYHRYAHLHGVDVKLGDKVKKGDKIGEVGKTGYPYYTSHLHYDIFKKKPSSFLEYTINWTKKQVASVYEKPHKYVGEKIPTENHHLGYDWLDWYGKGYHTGIDINGKGGGNADLGNPVYSTTDGEVVYIYDGAGKNGGWGKMIVISETQSRIVYKVTDELKKAIEKITGNDNGNNMNENEQNREAENLLDEFENKTDEITKRNNKITNQSEEIKRLNAVINKKEKEIEDLKKSLEKGSSSYKILMDIKRIILSIIKLK